MSSNAPPIPPDNSDENDFYGADRADFDREKEYNLRMGEKFRILQEKNQRHQQELAECTEARQPQPIATRRPLDDDNLWTLKQLAEWISCDKNDWARRVDRLVRLDPYHALEFLRGDPVKGVQLLLIGMLHRENPIAQEALAVAVEEMRIDLAGPNPSQLELLLVDRILTCWLQVQLADQDCVGISEEAMELLDFHDRLRTRANRRFHDALKTLATIRKLALPTIQFNIAQKQVNVSG